MTSDKTSATRRDDVVDSFATLSTSVVSDALDRLGIVGQALGIRALNERLHGAGRAFTVFYQPVDVAGGSVGDYIDDVAPGSMVVIDNRGRLDATVWGDLLTLAASRRGLAGTVIDGVCRDIAGADLAYPMFARGHWMRTGKDRVQMVAVQTQVTIGGVRVTPDDVVVGDSGGVVVVPRARETEVLDAAIQIEAKESQIRARVLAGSRLDEARAKEGYHRLQSSAEAAGDLPR